MIFALVLLALSGVEGLLQDKWVFEEKFAGKPGKGWAWTREDAASWKVEKNTLQLKALPGTLTETANSTKNLLLRDLPPADDGTIAVEALVASAPAVEGEEAGVLLYQDDDTYVKLARTILKGKPHVVFGRELKGFAVTITEREEPAASHRLRIRWEDGRVLAELLATGAAKWVVAGYAEAPFAKGAALKAGLYAQGSPAAGVRSATFSEFRLGSPATVVR